MKTTLWIVIGLLVVILIIAGAVLFTTTNTVTDGTQDNGNNLGNDNGQTGTGGTGNSGGQQTTPTTYNVEIINFAFTPLTLTIKKGDTVTSDTGNELDSSLFSQGQTYSHTFNEPGIYNYHCTPHPYMKAKIIVE